MKTTCKSLPISLLLTVATPSCAAFQTQQHTTFLHKRRTTQRNLSTTPSVPSTIISDSTEQQIDAALSEQTAVDYLLVNNNQNQENDNLIMSQQLLEDMHTILDDGHGHMNADLAQSIWNWENSQRLEHVAENQKNNDDNKTNLFPAAQLNFSTRQGLRLVDSLAREKILANDDDIRRYTSSRNRRNSSTSQLETYNDLVQEGVVALMSAMAQFDPSTVTDSDDTNAQFLDFATNEIDAAMKKVLIEGVREQNRFLPRLTTKAQKEGGTAAATPSTTGITIEKNEGTVQPHDPIVAPLRDFVVEDNPTPEDIALTDMIQHDISEFLERTLDERELSIIRLKFGLDILSLDGGDYYIEEEDVGDGKHSATSSMSSKDISNYLGLDLGTVQEIEEQALDKLRASFSRDYIGAYLDDDPFEEVSL